MSEVTGKQEGEPEWFQTFTPLMVQSFSIIEKLEDPSFPSKISEEALTILNQVVDGLPGLLRAIKDCPKPKHSELQKCKKSFEGGLMLYIEASRAGVRFYERPSRVNQGFFLGLMETARDEIKKSNDSLHRFRMRA